MAFESLAVISNALSTIEAGQLSICSFGQSVEIIHGFQQPFTDQSGANVIKCCKFDEDGTHIGQVRLNGPFGMFNSLFFSYSKRPQD